MGQPLGDMHEESEHRLSGKRKSQGLKRHHGTILSVWEFQLHAFLILGDKKKQKQFKEL